MQESKSNIFVDIFVSSSAYSKCICIIFLQLLKKKTLYAKPATSVLHKANAYRMLFKCYVQIKVKPMLKNF